MSRFSERVRDALAPDYVVERELGGGGMGVVFVAREPALGRRVAVKVLRPETATATAAERFRREGHTLATASHPNVVTVHKADQRAGLSYLVMELLEGSLADRLREGLLPEAQALRLALPLLDGLAHLHRLGIVHRDIKPANIFLRGDRAVLGDFGIATRPHSDDEPLTQDGQHPGTPAYSPPEQLADREVTAAADLYAMGGVVYEMLTGRRWPGIGDGKSTDWRGVRRPIARVLQRALAYEPGRRWPDAESFARALRRAGRRVPPGAWLGVLTTAALVGVAAVILARGGGGVPAPPIADVAVLPLRADPGDSLLALKVAHAISEHLEHAFRDPDLQLRVTPMPLVIQWWGRQAMGDSLPAVAFEQLHVRRIVWGRLEPGGAARRVVLEIQEQAHPPQRIASRALAPGAETDAGYGLAQQVVEVIEPEWARSFEGSPLRGRNSAAVDSLMAGERAFWRENWDAAERLHRAAIRIDPGLGRAWWGLYNVERWRRGGFDVNLDSIYALYPADFHGLDALLIRADLASGGARLRAYERAARAFPNHAYPWLLLGNELFHRGPLLGIPLDSAVAVLRTAAERDPYMAPVFSTMTWALIRLGDSAGSRRALDHYATVASPSTQEEFCFRCVLEVAHAARFTPDRLPEVLDDMSGGAGGAGALGRALRWGLSFGVPEGQLAVGALLAGAAPDVAGRADAVVGQALALVALGRVAAALALFDSAAALTGAPELALQAAEWRVLLPVLGVPGVEPEARAAGAAALRRLSEDSRALGARARWALAIDATAAGDTAAGQGWVAGLDTAMAGADRLRALTAAFASALAGDTAEALRRSLFPPALAAGRGLGDPFARAAFHLSRGAWLLRSDRAAADRALLWYQNSDAVGWPAGPPQAAEIDWALETVARFRRATMPGTGDHRAACRLLPDVARRWREADPSYDPMRRTVATLLEGCRS